MKLLASTDIKILISTQVDDFIKYIAKEATDELVGFDRSGKAKKKIEL